MGRWSLVTPPTKEEGASTGAGAPIAPLDDVARGKLEPPVAAVAKAGGHVTRYCTARRNRLGGTERGRLILIQSGERMPAW